MQGSNLQLVEYLGGGGGGEGDAIKIADAVAQK